MVTRNKEADDSFVMAYHRLLISITSLLSGPRFDDDEENRQPMSA